MNHVIPGHNAEISSYDQAKLKNKIKSHWQSRNLTCRVGPPEAGPRTGGEADTGGGGADPGAGPTQEAGLTWGRVHKQNGQLLYLYTGSGGQAVGLGSDSPSCDVNTWTS